ncbi:MAG TPA: T9SS type A sorting domain-containing protein, partial [Bacteroidia bacterium]|nr:T9SS type A sorting domain-containing protein [Bacteroidia bacterium]
TAGPSMTATVTTTNPAVGTYRLEGSGGANTHMTGLYASITPVTPTSMGWWIYPTGGSAVNYLVVGNTAVTGSNCVAFTYFLGSTANIRFVSSVNLDYPATVNTWYHLEMRNINWSMHTFDIYINNTLQYTSFPFRDPTQNDISRIHLYNYNTGMGYWDDIRVGTGGPPTVVTWTSTPTSCASGNNGSVDLSVTGGTPGYSYSWSNGATTQDISGLTAGTYSVTVLDANLCTVTQTASVTEPPPITAAGTTQSNVSCNGGSNGYAAIMAGGGTPSYTYSWSTGGTGPSVMNLSAGTYTCTTTDGNGCTMATTFTITQPPALTATTSQTDPNCNGANNGTASVNVSGGVSPYTYSWSSGGNSSTATNLAAGTHSCSITDANGCILTQTVTLTQPPGLTTVFSTQSVTCNGGANGTASVMVSGGSGSYTYNWSSGGTAPMATGLSAGTHTVIITDASTCTFTYTVNVTQPTPVNATFTQSDVSCGGAADGTASVVASGGTGPYNYAWSNGGTGSTETGLSAGTFSVAITDANGCTITQTVTITEPDPITGTTTTIDPTSCGGLTGSIDLTVGGGTPGFSYLWSESSTTQDITSVPAGIYSVTITDSEGCTMVVSVTLNDPPPPAVSLSLPSSVLCLNDAPLSLSGESPLGGSWSGTGVTGMLFTPLTAGNGMHAITYSFTDGNNCTGTAVDSILVDPCVGISTSSEPGSWNIYPNPTTSFVTISGNVTDGNFDVEVFAMDGRLVFAGRTAVISGKHITTINFENEPSGIYFLRIVNGELITTAKIIRR